MRESTVLFGESKSIVGVVTDPAADAPPRQQACLLLNSGYIHRSGPQRLYVKMARRLAQSGFVTMRFDYSGIGDSPTRADNMQFAKAAIVETREAMSFLESSRGISQFAAGGICWGADNAFRACHEDERMVGAFCVDFYSLPSMRQWLRLYLRRLLSPRSWRNLVGGNSAVLGRGAEAVSGALKGLFSRRGGGESAAGSEDLVQRVLREIGEMLERGADLGFVFASGGTSVDHYKSKFKKGMAEMQGLAGDLQTHFVDSDHIFTTLHDQGLLLDLFDEWMQGVARSRTTADADQGQALV